MEISIYQINIEHDKDRVAFYGMEDLMELKGGEEIDSSIYDAVYSGVVECSNLEDVYRMFNLNHPDGYRGRSLSVSDIVEVKSAKDVDPGFYFCDNFGFQKIAFTAPEMHEQATMRVLLVEPGKLAKEAFIGTSLESMQAVVDGDIEQFMPFEDEVAIICNEEGKINGMQLNRAVYAEPEQTELSYKELVSKFREAEQNGKHISGFIVFTEDSFDKPYPIEARTYAVSSNTKAFQPNMGGYSIYGSSLDGSDVCVRLENYMEAERGGKDGWKIEKCYTQEDSKEMVDIVAGKFFVCAAPSDSENFEGLSDKQMQKYMKLFRYPEQFFRINDEIKAVQFDPDKNKNYER
ncbi:MAG: YodL domain-containing protein [Eubacteriales bacterium]|nr:YodL domain-containing protein [Eubacteriales bacterium]